MIRRRRSILLTACLTALALSAPAGAQADFGFAPESAAVTAREFNGTIDTQAGSHPYAFNVEFELNTTESGEPEGGELRDLLVKLPPGLIGNPLATPRCEQQDFEGGTPQCPFASQVGVVKANIVGIGQGHGPIYNIKPPPGVPAMIGFSLANLNALLLPSVKTEEGYGIDVLTPNLPVNVTGVNAEIWGTPADQRHDPERNRGQGGSNPSEGPLWSFLTLPASCEAPLEYTLEADSKLAPGEFVHETAQSLDAGGNPSALKGCESVPFEPELSSSPTANAAESPSGLGFELRLKNKGLLSPAAKAETEPKKTEVIFPPGLAVNASAANGIAACSLAQFKAEGTEPVPGQGCPDASKIGTLFANTPLLQEPIEGAVYLAAPHDNPFGSFLAIYIVARVPERGLLVKQAGEVKADPVTGQLTSVVDGLPPVPYSSFKLDLRSGPRAPLITPQLCGTYQTQVKLYPFSAPGTPVEKTLPFTIATGAGGAGCVASESQLPNSPSFEAGTVTPLAGAYSPLVFKMARADGSQRFSSIEATLPQGLTGKLAGVPYCSEPQIAAAQARSFEGGGAQELASPSCPSDSQVGVVNVAAGAGTMPYYVQGKAYLAGPYKGAPLSLVVIVPAIAGPFDLGAVVVRAGAYVNEETAQITVKSDPTPTILQGIPLDVRSIAIYTDRNQFMLNPTSCEESAVTAKETSTTGAVAELSSRFEVGGCAALDFTPKLSLSLKGGTKRTNHPALKAVLTQPKNQANIARVSVMLPSSEFIDQDHVGNPCTRPQFAAGTCPKISVLGTATAYSPLLDAPLTGKVYFLANGGVRTLPDLVADLNGQIHVRLTGFVDSVTRKGSEESRIRNTFAVVPDAPVSKFVLSLKGGKEGLLENSRSLCKGPQRASVKMAAQNGRVKNFQQVIGTSCRKR